jgi:hypothetical protein
MVPNSSGGNVFKADIFKDHKPRDPILKNKNSSPLNMTTTNNEVSTEEPTATVAPTIETAPPTKQEVLAALNKEVLQHVFKARFISADALANDLGFSSKSAQEALLRLVVSRKLVQNRGRFSLRPEIYKQMTGATGAVKPEKKKPRGTEEKAGGGGGSVTKVTWEDYIEEIPKVIGDDGFSIEDLCDALINKMEISHMSPKYLHALLFSLKGDGVLDSYYSETAGKFLWTCNGAEGDNEKN